MDHLYAHLHRWMAEPFVWGKSDCILSLADYVMSLGHPDPAAKWRGTYDSALTCQRVSGFLNDPVRLIEEGVAPLGFARVQQAERGDIGVIRFTDDGKVVSTGAICLGNNWAVRGEQRLVIGAPISVVAAWRVFHA
ncbi:DUF6950 family protein [Oryzicola mucosus]|uniref:DUF6950 domain-containing protein n=1 Tax=Oryzicola mucosus TaxID=2767425 RepID=A0A8J6TZQ2_9HYPH|nr:hypothetical protein [Oryzicola mucosus]MBD0416499.1 hypothetical protein [Oryzicola mucosus]